MKNSLTVALLLFSTTAVWGAITSDVNVSKNNSSASSTVTSAAFSTSAGNELLLAFVSTDAASGANTTVTGVSGGGLVWELVVRTNAQKGTSEIWRAFAPAPVSGATVTATLSRSVASSMTVMSFAGVDTSGTNGSGAIGATGTGNASRGAPAATLITTRNGSWVFGVGNDYDNATARTVPAGQALVHQYLSSSGDTYWVQMLAAPTPLSGTSVTLNDTAPTGDRYNLSICEILPAAGGGSQTWSISGTISPAAGGAGATVTLSGAASATTTADASGNYSFANLANGSYTVTPSKTGFTFTPANQPVTVNGANVSSINFTATPLTWSISGNISPAAGGSGATVTLSGAASASTTADASGNYSFANLANGSYTVTPSKTGFTFTPANQPVTVNGANVSSINFTATAATWSISGNISPAAGGAGATVTLSGAASASTTADASGNYSFANLANGSYTVTPSKTGYTFTPANQPVTISGSSISNINFTATVVPTWSISGTISPAAGGAGATVTLSGAASASTTTDGSGNYSFASLANGSYIVTPSNTGYTFTPASQPVSVNSANVSAINFTASQAAPASLAIDATVSKNQSAATSVTSPAFSTTSADELLLAFVATDYLSGANTTVTGVTGAGLTWELVQRTNVQSGTSEIWRAFAPAALSSVTVKATLSQRVSSMLTVVSFIGADASGVNGSGAIGATGTGNARGTPTASLVTTRANSWVFGVGNDFDNATARTVPANQSMVHQYLTSAGDTYWAQMLTGPTPLAGTNITLNDTAPTGDRYNLSICEVLPALGGGSPQTWSISGTISPTAGGSGATVTLSGAASASTTADASGNYSFASLANGSYTVTPSKTGFTFTPASQPVTVNGANVSAINFSATSLTWSISGTISPTAGGSGATVTLSGAASATTTTDASGNYSFANLANGSYTVTPSKTGFTFTPASQPVTVNGANVSNINFSATAATWSISGNISPTAGGSGATVTLSGAASATTTADASGNYSFASLANGSYTVTPSKTGFTFTPASLPVTISGASVSNINFTATVVPAWSISGNISPAAGGGAGATVTLSGSASATTTADASGNYSFNNLANGSYTVTPSNTGFTFTPANLPATVNGANVSGINFTAQASTPSPIHLLQSNANGNELAVSSLSAAFPSSNTAGDFLIVTGTAARPSTTLTISDTAGNTYLPAFGPVTDPTQNVTAYVWYVPNCKGGPNTVTVTPATSAATELHISEWSGVATTSPVDQTSSATGSGTAISSGAKITTADGELIFGYTFPVNSSSAGAGFTGISLVNGDLDEYQVQSTAGSIAATFTQSSGSWFALMVTFKAASGGPPPPTWNISGTISPTTGGAGATVTLSGASSASTTADASGNYSFTHLANGSYTVTPSGSGYTFTPQSLPVTINGADATGINFTASVDATPPSLAIDSTVSQNNAAANTSVTSPSFSTNSANELLLAFVATDYLSGANTTVTGVTGGGLTWQLVARTNAQSGTSEIWRAFAAVPLNNVTVSAALSHSVQSSLTVISFTGADPSGINGSGAIGATASGSGASGLPLASLVTTRNNSWVFGVGNDYDRAVARTVPTGESLVHQYLSASGDTYWVQMQNTPTPVSGTTVTINDTAPSGDQYNLAICEVLPAGPGGGGGDNTPPTVSMASPAIGATVASRSTLWANASDNVSVAGVQFLLDGAPLGTELTTKPYTMTWDSTTATNGPHTLSAEAIDGSGLMTTSAPVNITVDNSGNPAVVGSWSSVINTPAVAVNLVLLKNGKVLFYEDGNTPTVWDYVNGTFTNAPTAADLFCSGHALLADGRILVVGGFGGSGSSIGISSAEIFDPSNNSWTTVPHMAYKRWYPSATTLPDGRILVTAGWQTSDHTNAGIPEIYDPGTNTWTQLTSANNPFETYPFIYVLPDGRVIHVGNSEYATVTDILDLTTNTWSVVDPNIVDGSSSSMYLPAKIMKAGAAADSQMVGPASNTTYVLDMTQPSPAWQQTPSMAYPRSFMNLTTLPDGSVLVTGGETDKNGGDISKAVYAAELWSPKTQTWSTMASMHTPREYHGTALLLPDGRVLESGMGADFGNVPNEDNAEFYSPPYLFKGPRPTISQAPSQVQYGANFFVGTPDAANITTVTLIRTGAVTHFFDENTRYLPLTFQQTTGGLTITAPANANLAPPGYYMLFLVNSAGVPSIAPFVQIPGQ